MAGSPADPGTAAAGDNPAAVGDLAGTLPAVGRTGRYLEVTQSTAMYEWPDAPMQTDTQQLRGGRMEFE